MCGFIFSYRKNRPDAAVVERANQRVSSRGPNRSHAIEIPSSDGDWIYLSHHLLDISGRAVLQPFTSDQNPAKWLLFNGEIYNYRSISTELSDTEAIIPAFVNLEERFPESVLGEFAICVFDSGRLTLDLFTDPFLTKPVFLGRTSNPAEFGIASYASALTELGFHTIRRAEPNTHYQVKLGNESILLVERFPTVRFNLDQNVPTYDRFIECLIESVRMRASHGTAPCALSLSSGYDSGAISLALNLLDLPYQTIGLNSGEDVAIMTERLRINQSRGVTHHNVNPIGKFRARELSSQIEKNIEKYPYEHMDGPSKRLSLHSDPGALGAYLIAQKLRDLGISVNLSGSGGDEIYSDYGYEGRKIYYHSEFGGLFPDDMNGFFPWRKFYGDTQRSYLFKEELVFGHFGIESRYPLLDRQLVQEFLSLTPELKNREYKAPLAAFFRKYDYPFESQVKRGFSIRKPTLRSRVKEKLKNLVSERR